MSALILLAVLYLAVLIAFRRLAGVATAGSAMIQDWGRRTAA